MNNNDDDDHGMEREAKRRKISTTIDFEQYCNDVKESIKKESFDDERVHESIQVIVRTIDEELKRLVNNTNSTSSEPQQQQSSSSTNHDEATITTVTTTEQATSSPNKKKYSQFLQNFFPKPFTDTIRFDSEEALSYITPWKDAEEVASELLTTCFNVTRMEPTHIIDGTGGLGGNTLGFLRYYWKNFDHSNCSLRKLTMCELNPERYQMAVYNVNLYREDQKKFSDDWIDFHSFNTNFVTWWRKHKSMIDVDSTIVFMDPPWGGQEYKNHDIIQDLYLNVDDQTSISIRDFTNEILSEGVLAVLLKVPHNYSDRTLTENNNKRRLRSFVMKKVKYILITNTNNTVTSSNSSSSRYNNSNNSYKSHKRSYDEYKRDGSNSNTNREHNYSRYNNNNNSNRREDSYRSSNSNYRQHESNNSSSRSYHEDYHHQRRY
jgi:hypothetical protein